MPLFARTSNEERAARLILETDAPIGSDTRCLPLLCAEPKSKRMCCCVRAALDVEFVSLFFIIIFLIQTRRDSPPFSQFILNQAGHMSGSFMETDWMVPNSYDRRVTPFKVAEMNKS